MNGSKQSRPPVIAYKTGGQSGGYLRGPSHEDGGIPATITSTGEEIELEGQEYIINADTVRAVGIDFLDALNSTATRHHPASQGFSPGELPDSKYETGGPIFPAEKELSVDEEPFWPDGYDSEAEGLASIPGWARPCNGSAWNVWTGENRMWEDQYWLEKNKKREIIYAPKDDQMSDWTDRRSGIKKDG